MLTISNASAGTIEENLAGTKAPPFSAGKWVCAPPNSVGKGCFREDGDWFEIVDEKEDGHSTVVVWHSVYPRNQATVRQGLIWHTGGFQTYRWTNKNFEEGWNLEFRVCAGEYGNRHIIENSCTQWKTTKS
ncbi:hypothetical protein [Streptomyces sp. NBC_01237]|uniref:hypothetical protein n=1 Tax=Streptomyces sp. NBC_01237 TaxID=2903790 RepID=UPI002DD8FE87|nr:hypothetical protein [Streptomyces sp. NBC_01237]WRZ77154.1 hypothetical protein OG251_36390 [Streptomyces sp. NBC_01237]WRZ78458.1 hypothetical protein OG251_43260 [Streptomyces sp. NBC_01237]